MTQHPEGKLFRAAWEIQKFFESQRWEFVFIGGLANLRWGQPRTTEDVDATLLTLFADEERIVKTVLEHFQARIPNAESFSLQNRVLLLTAANGVGIDVSLGGLPFEQEMIDRSSFFAFEKGYELRTCSAEDLIVLKAFAAREKDWADIRMILERQKGKINIEGILTSLQPLCDAKEEPEILPRLSRMFDVQQ